MIDELKSNVTLHPIGQTSSLNQIIPPLLKWPLHPIGAPQLQTVQALSPRVKCCENFLRR